MAHSPIVIVVLILSLSLGASVLYIAMSSRRHKTRVGRLGLLGMQGRVETALVPGGAIILDGELWRARVRHYTPPLPPGHTVRVVGVDGHFLIVEPME